MSVDAKGRLALPARYRERILEAAAGAVVLTINPRDLCLWLYPLPEWEQIEAKLATLPDFDKPTRRIKQMMRGYAQDCELDTQGRILISQELRSIAGIDRKVILSGQGNKFEVWNEDTWTRARDEWIADIDNKDGEPSQALESLSF